LLTDSAGEIQLIDTQGVDDHLILFTKTYALDHDVNSLRSSTLSEAAKGQKLKLLIAKAVEVVKLIAGCIYSFAGLSNYTETDMPGNIY
jgi:hypothetical protein